ncbi:MAG: MlaA family lipoprotein [Syntrophobacteraceae bacterium]
MRKTTTVRTLFFLLLCSPLCFPILAGAQIFNSRAQSVSPQSGQMEQKVWDPLESSNRKVFYFNDLLYSDFVKPITVVYRKLPAPVRKVVRNGFDNLETPSRAVNLALQGKPRRARDEVTRFVVNSTAGVGGMFDVAGCALGIQDHDADFGETLGTWCVGPGPYLVVPALGPSDTRDLVGLAADHFMDPLYWVPGPIWLGYAVDAVKYTSKASDHIDQYEAMKKASLDPYVAMRNAYMQHREALISDKPQRSEVVPTGASLAEDAAREQAAAKAKAEALALARAEERSRVIKPRKNASSSELARALRKAVENESGRTSLATVVQEYPQLAGAVAARNAIARDADFRPDWGQDNRERLNLATEMICSALARGDLFARGADDPSLEQIRATACVQQRRLAAAEIAGQ